MITQALHATRSLRHDLPASLVVFLMALPLCVGIAAASGVPAELGLVTGIVGGIAVGFLPGSSLQVSGPAAGLTVLVYEAVAAHGLDGLAVIVLLAGLLQVLLGLVRFGRWFRAISSAVVLGMLAGIGLVLIISQSYVLFDHSPPGTTLENLMGLPGLLLVTAGGPVSPAASLLGVGTLVALVAWRHTPKWLRVVPAQLAAVLLATVTATLLDLPVNRIEVHGILDAVRPLDSGHLATAAQVGVLGSALTFAFIASAESLFSANAIDQMHSGPRTQYDKELVAQGVGNTLCGLLGALPMTAVIARSAANVQAGAVTKASRVLHGVWLLLFAALLPAVLQLIPMAALAAVLIHTGAKLVQVRTWARLWRTDRGEAIIFAATTVGILTANLLEGVLFGLILAVLRCAWNVSHVDVSVEETPDVIRVRLTGNATFIRLPRLLDAVESVPHHRRVELDLSGLRHLDEACRTALLAWAEQRTGGDTQVHLPVSQRG